VKIEFYLPSIHPEPKTIVSPPPPLLKDLTPLQICPSGHGMFPFSSAMFNNPSAGSKATAPQIIIIKIGNLFRNFFLKNSIF
jgi:hypothetical protein